MQETQETQIQSLGQEDPLEEEMTTHSGILAWRIPRTEGPGGIQSAGSQESDPAERLDTRHKLDPTHGKAVQPAVDGICESVSCPHCLRVNDTKQEII